MQIVLIKKVKTLGNPGEIKDVKRGYAINFLIPGGFATPATKGLIKEAGMISKKFNKANVVDDSAMIALIKEIDGLEITILAKANEKGSLFAAVKAEDIVAEIANKIGKSIDTDYVVIKEPIKKAGEYEIGIAAGDKKGTVKLKVEAADENKK